VADTYNHKIKIVDPAASSSVSLAGTGKSGTGAMGGKVQFFEPASLSAASATELFIADTNNHRIVRLNPANGDWKELTIEGLDRPGGGEAVPRNAKDAGARSLAAGKALSVDLGLQLPAGNHLTQGAPISLKISDGVKTLYSTTLSAPAAPSGRPRLTATVPAEILSSSPPSLYVTVYYTHCSEGLSAVCTPAEASWKIGATFSANAAETLELAQ
jgi:hypothetical protein